jgi:hypothetical protein
MNADGRRADVARAAADCGLRAGRAIRDAVQAMDPAERGRPAASRLKAANVYADAHAEAIGLQHLAELARAVGRRILVLLDDRGRAESVGASSHREAIWCCFDAIDGTKKVAGIRGHDPRRLDAANDGVWAATFAFTAPTAKPFAELALADFVAAAVVDGNPALHRTYPQEVICVPEAGAPVSYEVHGDVRRRVFTTSAEVLQQCWVVLDSFQAYDRDTHRPGDEELAVGLYRLLINRHAPAGAHDVLRLFGSLSALCRTMLGWREEPVWIESQGGAFIVVNENLPNLIPAAAVIAGAGGLSVDFDGRPLAARRLAEGRTSVIHAANAALRDRCLEVVGLARARLP